MYSSPFYSSLSFTLSFLSSMLELWIFFLLKRFSWLRIRYESMVEIHPFCLFSITIIWLVTCRVHSKSNRFDLIFKIQNLYINFHATWFSSEFVKAQTHMSILCHLALDYWCLGHIEICSCSAPIVYSAHILARHLLVTR